MNSFKNYFRMSLILLLTILFIQPVDGWAQKNVSDIKQLFEERDREIKALLGPKGTEYTDEQREKLKNIINGNIDYGEMAQFALGDTYDELSAEKQNEFINLFSTIIRDQSLNKLDIYRAKVTYEDISVEGDSAFVSTIAELDKVRTPVGYEMKYKEKDGYQQWVVTDMVIDDVSTAGSYQQQFQRIIRKKGFDSLMETLRKRAER